MALLKKRGSAICYTTSRRRPDWSCTNTSHFEETKSQKGRFWQEESSNFERKYFLPPSESRRAPEGVSLGGWGRLPP